MDKSPPADPLPRELGLWDAVSLIVGIVVGVGIFETPPLIFQNLNGPWTVLGVWALAGVLCLFGALCYSELATTYPREGGDYAYLTRAYGPWVGFIYGWATIAIILTANLGMMTYIFADYAHHLFNIKNDLGWILAGDAVLLLTLINLLGVRAGKRTQNTLTLIKVVGIASIVIAGLGWPSADAAQLVPSHPRPLLLSNLSSAFVFVLFTYGGWNEAAYVVAELRDGRRNIPRALIFGVSAILLIYVLTNFAYLRGLGYDAAMESKAVAADVLKGPLGENGERFISLLVMFSALGSANGIIFTGSRVSMFLGRDHPVFASLGRCHQATSTPYLAMAFQAALTLLLIRLVGTEMGRSFLDTAFNAIHLPIESSWTGKSGFELLLKCTTPVFWLFFFLTGLSLFVLRFRDPDRPRPFPVPGYPLTPLLFCLTTLFMLYSSIDYARSFSLVGVGLLLLGFPLYAVSQVMKARTPVLTQKPASSSLGEHP